MNIYALSVNWSNIVDPVGRMFTGGNITDPITGNTTHVTGMFGGDPTLFAVFLFLAFLLLTLMFGLGLIVGSVVLLPISFYIFRWVPDFRIIVGILAGLIFGLALHRLIRR